MKLILDNEVIFSILNPNSTASYIFFSLKPEFFSPEYVKGELKEHREECLSWSGLSEHEFDMRLTEIEKLIEFSKLQEYKDYLKNAIKSIPDPEDSPYLALAIAKNCPIWSNDQHFQEQSLVKTYTTKELVNLLLRGQLPE